MSTSTTATSSYNASGLSSGIDWSSMIDKMVELESQPITKLQTKQTALYSQVSQLGGLASKVSSLKTAVDSLSGGGVISVKATSTNTAFSAKPGTEAVSGSYSIQVNTLARPAKARSETFTSEDTVQAGTLNMRVMGKDYSVTIEEGSSLTTAANAIRASGAPISVSIISDGTTSALSITNRDSGFPLDQTPDDALTIYEESSGSSGNPLGFTSIQEATNAAFIVDGMSMTRTSNVVSDAVPGTTLTLTAANSTTEDLVLENDLAGTVENLQKFVTAYNDLAKTLQAQLNVSETTDRASTLAGDSTVRNLQNQLQSILVRQVGSGDVRTLADLGLTTAQDGTLSLNETTLGAAISKNPAAVNSIFSDATSGIGKLVDDLAKVFADSSNGLLVLRQNSIKKSATDIDDEKDRLQLRIDNYRKKLVAQFTAMENTISSLKSIGQYLTQQENKSSSS